jgi:hypothetical protein
MEVVHLFEFAKTARAHDDEMQQGSSTDTENMVSTGVVFHESRCGSTVVANQLLASFSPAGHTRVYSESAPPMHAN